MSHIQQFRLLARFALITGASRGIGRAVAERFAAEGAIVAINHWRDGEAAQETLVRAQEAARSNGHAAGDHIVIEADVSNQAQVSQMMDQLVGRWKRLDIAVNNAGIQAPTPGAAFDSSVFERIIAVNLLGATYVSDMVIRHFLSRQGGGVIINTSSVHEVIPKPGFLAYSLSKGGMGNLTRTLALEFAGNGIRVNAVGPGAIVTDINKAWIGDPEKRHRVESHIPIGRAGDPSEIAPIFAFLASDEAAYITGQTLFACGGLTLYAEFARNWSS